MAGAGQQRHRRKQQSKSPGHVSPLWEKRFAERKGHNRRDFASLGGASCQFSSAAVKKATTVAAFDETR
jgi:3,4-dihydroxy-2-butanone 4-phosphate synthase